MTLCLPCVIFIVFCAIQIIIDISQQYYNTAICKSVIMVLVSFLLNALCENGLGLVSWIFIFIPFIFMTVITATLLYMFSLHPKQGTVTPDKGNLIARITDQ